MGKGGLSIPRCESAETLMLASLLKPCLLLNDSRSLRTQKAKVSEQDSKRSQRLSKQLGGFRGPEFSPVLM